jgi:hypothetical protein
VTSPRRFTATLQTGLSDTFQLTLGGMFGEGPAWQNRITLGVANALRSGDLAYIYGWDTMDTRTAANDWQAGAGYRVPVLRKGRQALALTVGFQHWRFPSVKCGTNDWLTYEQLAYNTKVAPRFPFLVTSESWTLLKSPLPTGTLLHTQAWLQYDILKHDKFTMAFRNGPAHTYSWNFYGTQGNRVIRYQTMLIMNWKNMTLEGGVRHQWGLQPGIPHNNYWAFGLSRTL